MADLRVESLSPSDWDIIFPDQLIAHIQWIWLSIRDPATPKAPLIQWNRMFREVK